MMKNVKNISFILLLSGLLAFFMINGCQKVRIAPSPPGPSDVASVKKSPPPWAPAHGYRAKYRYRYYPSAFVYFDVERSLYFYSDGGNWQATASLPARITLDPNEFEILDMHTDKPYEFHPEVVKRYPPQDKKKREKNKGNDKAKSKQ